jgi:hypothetical protein
LAPSHITRWETGELTVSYAVVRRSEQMLGAAAESFVAICDAVLRFTAPGPGVVVLGRGDESGVGADGQLHELLDRATRPGAMTSQAWSDLVAHVQARPGLALHPPSLWGALAEQLLSELVVAGDHAWLARQEALSRLLEHRVACRYVIEACVAITDDPDVPAFIEPISLLDVTADPRANAYVLRQLRRPHNDRALQGALLAAVRKVRLGHFRSNAEWTTLIGAVGEIMAEPTPHPTILPIAVELSRSLARRVPQAAVLYHNLPATATATRSKSGAASVAASPPLPRPG